MTIIDLGMYMVKSMWAFSYATASFATLVLTGVAISGAATKNRSLNIALCLLSNHLSELPLTIMFTDACFYTWLNVTGIFRKWMRRSKRGSLLKQHADININWNRLLALPRTSLNRGVSSRAVFLLHKHHHGDRPPLPLQAVL